MRGTKSLRQIHIGLICLLLCLGFFSCALSPKETTKEDPRTKGEKHHPPLSFPQDQEIVTQKDFQNKDLKGNSEKDQITKSKKLEKGRAALPYKVYRVQFFATQYPDEAAKMSDMVKNQLAENTYIDYKTPYYWVRVGDCATKEEAESLLAKIRNLGYQESWVIEVKIEP